MIQTAEQRRLMRKALDKIRAGYSAGYVTRKTGLSPKLVKMLVKRQVVSAGDLKPN